MWPDKPIEFCEVPGDALARHFAIRQGQEIVCVASIYLSQDEHGRSIARLRKFATLTEFQGQGLGSVMLEHILKQLTKESIYQFWFDARESALSFYARFGFAVTGERFFKSNVPYFKMQKILTEL